jgi:formate dehydrogenase major subunit/formate dehydrogenase alpha subunit
MDDVSGKAAAFFIIGSNTTEQHPVFGTMLRRAVSRRGAKLIVADPRSIDITEFATLHIRHRPGTDVALINGLMNIILEKGLEDKECHEAHGRIYELVLLAQYPPTGSRNHKRP